MDYVKVGKRNYDLTCIKVEGINTNPVDGDRLLDLAANAFGHKLVALFLPRNINGTALMVLCPHCLHTTEQPHGNFGSMDNNPCMESPTCPNPLVNREPIVFAQTSL
jgi:hypothetical protein